MHARLPLRAFAGLLSILVAAAPVALALTHNPIISDKKRVYENIAGVDLEIVVGANLQTISVPDVPAGIDVTIAELANAKIIPLAVRYNSQNQPEPVTVNFTLRASEAGSDNPQPEPSPYAHIYWAVVELTNRTVLPGTLSTVAQGNFVDLAVGTYTIPDFSPTKTYSLVVVGDGRNPFDNEDTSLDGQLSKTEVLYHAVLVPIEMRITARDDPKKKWADNVLKAALVYSGNSTGDMVSWKLGGTNTWGSTGFTWTAEEPGGETITGPTGAGKSEWSINDADQDTTTNWLKWKPGKWKIKVQIGSTTAEFEQEVGWRTEDYVVIGQIVETHAHDGDAPPLVAVGDNFWEISSPVALYRQAVLFDMLDLPVFDGLPDAARNTLAITPLPITAKLSEAWFGYWYLMPAVLTPKGPFTQAHPSGNGNVQNGHRFWAMQHIFNVSPDAPLAPQSFTPEGFEILKNAEQYRVIHRYKSKFVVTPDGKIDSNKIVLINHVAEGGPTKMNFGVAAGEFAPIWNNPAYTFFNLPKQPSDTNQYQGAHAVSQDGMKLSYFATRRVGAGGQNVNWRLMGKDAPWIFSEIIVELKPDRTVAAQIKASVDKSWNETTGAVAGETAFNNINIYKLQRNLQTDDFEFARQELMAMEGELEPFINSASGLRPEPPIPPSVQ